MKLGEFYFWEAGQAEVRAGAAGGGHPGCTWAPGLEGSLLAPARFESMYELSRTGRSSSLSSPSRLF